MKVKVLSKKEIADKTFEVKFSRPKDFQFKAGQHLEFILPRLNYPDPKGQTRVFSIVTRPSDRDFFAVAFRRRGSGFKETLLEMEGEEITIEGPFGNFILPKEEKGENIFIAGGIGITPFMSIIRTALSEKKAVRMTLLYGNKNKETSAYLNELGKLSKENSNFSVDLIFGHIKSEHLEKYSKQKTDSTWWLVGPPAMVSSTRLLLESFGVSDGKIRIEEFSGY